MSKFPPSPREGMNLAFSSLETDRLKDLFARFLCYEARENGKPFVLGRERVPVSPQEAASPSFFLPAIVLSAHKCHGHLVQQPDLAASSRFVFRKNPENLALGVTLDGRGTAMSCVNLLMYMRHVVKSLPMERGAVPLDPLVSLRPELLRLASVGPRHRQGTRPK